MSVKARNVFESARGILLYLGIDILKCGVFLGLVTLFSERFRQSWEK